MPPMHEYLRAIDVMAATGASLDDIERELIDPLNLDDERASALWLYAYSYTPADDQRAEARAHLRRLGHEPDEPEPARC